MKVKHDNLSAGYYLMKIFIVYKNCALSKYNNVTLPFVLILTDTRSSLETIRLGI